MRIYVSGATITLKQQAVTSRGCYLGHLVTPQNGNVISDLLRDGLPWAVDNSAFSNPDDAKFERILFDVWETMRWNPPDWVAVPDFVGDHWKTLELFLAWTAHWEYEFGRVEWPLAFVLQNGATSDSVPWDEIAAVFVGGDDDFKLRGSVDLIAEAKERKKIVHVGRVNSLKRLRWAHDIGADSVDGSGYSMFPDARIPRAIKHVESLAASPLLF